ncbi:MAG TPA: pyridoxal phosphate-dependent aminotransferase, partial [Cryomorphaceae bacterium]|nr:pyridoxal phosphate-dependent aminotransferase [Cryomorphaceae bacterium]
MKQERIYLSPPHLSGDENAYLEETLASNWVSPVGPHLDAWERELAERMGSKDCCLLNS